MEKDRQQVIVTGLIEDLCEVEDSAADIVRHIQMMALVLVHMTEVTLATLEYYRELKNPPKGLQRLAQSMVEELIQHCKRLKVQPYDTYCHASRLAQLL